MNINLLGAAMIKNRDDSKRFPKKKYGLNFSRNGNCVLAPLLTSVDILGNVLIFFSMTNTTYNITKIFRCHQCRGFFMILEEINGVYDFIRDSGRLSPINVVFDE